MPGLELSPQSLYADNTSLQSRMLRRDWYTARRNHQLTIIEACSDSRLILPYESEVHVRSIATGAEVEAFSGLYNDKRVQGAAIVNHDFCGGLKALLDLLQGKLKAGQSRTLSFVQNRLWHPDPKENAFESAKTTAQTTDKPILAVTQNHIEGVNSLHAIMLGDSQDIEISHDNLPQFFKDMLSRSQRQVDRLLAKYPDLPDTQKVQNPDAVVITSGVKPLQLRYPQTFERPGTAFQVTMPRRSVDSNLSISMKDFHDTLGQAEYALGECLNHEGHPELPFSQTHTLLIETGEMNVSDHLAQKSLSESDIVREWSKLPGRQILISQIHRGGYTSVIPFEL